MPREIPESDHPAYVTLTIEERYLWARQFRPLTRKEEAEVRSMTIEDRFHLVDILNHIGRLLDYHEYTEQEIETVRQRWLQLKHIYAERERSHASSGSGSQTLQRVPHPVPKAGVGD